MRTSSQTTAALSGDGKTVLVTHLLLDPGVSVIDAKALSLRNKVALAEQPQGTDKRIPNGVARGLYAAVPHPKTGEIWVPHMLLAIKTAQPDLDFDPPADADFAADLEAWRAECAVSREIVAAHDLDDTARPLDWYEDVDLRWLVLRMISEYAQHCGHADLLREGVDGKTGA